MPSFTVTAAGQLVTLDASGSGQAAFTVTNTSAQALKGRLLAKAQEPAKQEWLTVVGEPLRQFAPSATEQVVIAVKAAGAPPGSYAFRLNAVSEVNPDEDFTEGPSVSFAVAAPVTKTRFPVWIPIVALIVLLGIGAGLYFALKGGGDKKVATPVITLPLDKATFAPPADLGVAWDATDPSAKYIIDVEKCPAGCTGQTVPLKSGKTAGTAFIFHFEESVTVRVRISAEVGGKRSDPSPWREIAFKPKEPGGGGGGGGVVICAKIDCYFNNEQLLLHRDPGLGESIDQMKQLQPKILAQQP